MEKLDDNKRLFDSARYGRNAELQQLIRKGLNVNVANEVGYTPIFAASFYRQAEAVRRLIAAGADVNIPNRDGWTPLMAAANNGDVDTLKLLLDAHAQVNLVNRMGNSALTSAAVHGHLEAVRLLVAANADINFADRTGKRAIDWAREKNHAQLFQLLSAAEARIRMDQETQRLRALDLQRRREEEEARRNTAQSDLLQSDLIPTAPLAGRPVLRPAAEPTTGRAAPAAGSSSAPPPAVPPPTPAALAAAAAASNSSHAGKTSPGSSSPVVRHLRGPAPPPPGRPNSGAVPDVAPEKRNPSVSSLQPGANRPPVGTASATASTASTASTTSTASTGSVGRAAPVAHPAVVTGGNVNETAARSASTTISSGASFSGAPSGHASRNVGRGSMSNLVPSAGGGTNQRDEPEDYGTTTGSNSPSKTATVAAGTSGTSSGQQAWPTGNSPSSAANANANTNTNASLDSAAPALQLSTQFLRTDPLGVQYYGSWQQKPAAVSVWRQQALSEAALGELEAEAKKLCGLRHAQVALIFGVQLDRMPRCLAQELLEVSLEDVLLQRPAGAAFEAHSGLSWALRWRLAYDCAAGLAYLHANQVVHRRLRSANVLLTTACRARLAHYALAALEPEAAGQEQAPAAVAHDAAAGGDTAWKAPELLHPLPKYSQASDVFAYGMTLWEIASRKIPFADAPNETVMGTWILNGETEAFPEDAPPALASLAKAAWTFAPEGRATAAALASQAEPQWQEAERLARQALVGPDGRPAPEEFFCPISGELMQNPVEAGDGFAYERTFIEQWFASGRTTSPKTNQPIPQLVMPHGHLQDRITQFRNSLPR